MDPFQPPSPGHDDVRLRGFARRATVEEAIAWLDAHAALREPETVGLAAAAGRVLAKAVVSSINVPLFDRAMMDGFAVQAANTAGAAPYNRLPLAVVGQALPGRPFDGALAPGNAVKIATGAPLPTGAEAVLPAELAECDGDRVLAHGEVSPGKHVGRRGEDVSAGSLLFEPGRRLRPQDLGVLSSIGVAGVDVVRRPRVLLVITGSEVLEAGTQPRDYKIADANGPMLSALVARDGGELLRTILVPDDPLAIAAALGQPADVIAVSGGSSVGPEDHVPQLVAQLGELAIHGIAMRPSSPTGLGLVDGKLVGLLPGNPVSCLCAYDFFIGRAIRAMAGRDRGWPYPRVAAKLARKLNSDLGRVDYTRVKWTAGPAGSSERLVEPLATGGASILTSTTRADGFVIVPADCEGYPAGATVAVFQYDS